MEGLVSKTLKSPRGLSYRYYLSKDFSSHPSKKTILLYHGFPDSAHVWNHVAPLLVAKGFRLVLPDLLGFGSTAKPADPAAYSYRLMVEDITAILDAESVRKFVVVGHDWGAFLAQRTAALHPDRCEALVSVGIPYMPPLTEPVDLDAMTETFKQLLGYSRFEYWYMFTAPDATEIFAKNPESFWYAQHAMSPDFLFQMYCVPGKLREFMEAGRTDVELRPYAKDESLKQEWLSNVKDGFVGPFNWYHAMLENVQTNDDKLLGDGAQLEKPVLTIACLQDPVNPASMHEMTKALVPDVTVETVDSGHWIAWEFPEKLTELIVDFLKSKNLGPS